MEEDRMASVSLPSCIDIIQRVRNQYWENSSWDAKGMDRRAIWLAICLGFYSGQPVTSLTLKDGRNGEDRCLRVKDATFVILNQTSGVESRIKGGPLLAEYLKRPGAEVSSVLSVELVHDFFVHAPKVIARGTVGESTALDDFISWIQISRVKEDDEILTRYNPVNNKRKVIQGSDSRNALKETVVFFGLPEQNFSCASKLEGCLQLMQHQPTKLKEDSNVLSTENKKRFRSKSPVAVSTSYETLNMCIDIIQRVRNQYWENSSWDAKGMDRRAIWLAICLGFYSGQPVSNLTLKDGRNGEDRCLRVKDATFVILNQTSGVESRIKGGPLLAEYLKRPGAEVSSVLSVELVHDFFVHAPKVIARGTVGESTALDDFISWIQISRVKEDDEILTRYNPVNNSRKVIQGSDSRYALKETVVFFGLPEQNFSCASKLEGCLQLMQHQPAKLKEDSNVLSIENKKRFRSKSPVAVSNSYETLNMCIDIIQRVRNQYWENSSWDAKGMDRRAIWLAICLGFYSGLRVPSLTLKDGRNGEDRCLRVKDATFVILNQTSGVESQIGGGPLLAEYLKRPGVKVSSVVSVRLLCNKAHMTMVIARGTVGESTALDDFISWIQNSRVKEDDEILTRYNPVNNSRKVIQGSDSRNALKETVAFFGLPEQLFSCASKLEGCLESMRRD